MAVARGIFSGMVTGMAVSALALGAASLMTEIPGEAAPDAPAVEVPAGSEFNQSRDDTQAQLPQTGAGPDVPELPQVEAPVPDDLSAIAGATTETAAQPQTGSAEAGLSLPETGESTGGVAVGTEAPVLPSPQALAPEAPEAEEELSISTEPAQPPQPEISPESSAFPDDDPATGPEVMEEAPALPRDPATEGTVLQTGGDDAPAGAELAALPEEPAAPETSAADSAGETLEELAEEPVAQEPEPESQTQTAIEEPETSGTIGNMAEGVTTGRLPSVGGAAEGADGAAEAEEGAATEPAVDLPPIQRYAAEFENPDGRPLMAIVLIDDGTSRIGLDALQAFPYPLNFAVDAGWPGAPDAMRRYRDAGFEVLVLANLPENATPTDIEVAMQAYLSAVPEAVAVMEGPGSGLQQNREAAMQLADILGASGHGLVMYADGLNTAQKLVAREGVPAATVFRDFDAKGQSAAVIRRFLDQAAFKASRQEDGVIMVGRLRGDTTSALLLWGLQDRAGSVALAPVSRVLMTAR